MQIFFDGEPVSDIIEYKGFRQKRKDVHGPNGGMSINGVTILDLLARKFGIDIKCLPLPPARYNRLLRQLEPATVTVYITDGTEALARVMHLSSDIDGDFDDSTNRWLGVKFSLEEM